MYSYQTKIRYSEIGEDGRLRPGALVDAFQDCSTFQSEALAIGPAYAMEKGQAWLVASWQIEIAHLPFFGEEVEVATWPYKMDRFFGYRNFTMRSINGELLAWADSCWIFFDHEKQSMVRVTDEMREILGGEISTEHPMEKMPRKIALPEDMEEKTPFPVRLSDLDTNHHVNNGVYVKYASEFLHSDTECRGIRVEYVKAAKPTDLIYPRVAVSDGEITVNLAQENGKAFAIVQFLTDDSCKRSNLRFPRQRCQLR